MRAGCNVMYQPASQAHGSHRTFGQGGKNVRDVVDQEHARAHVLVASNMGRDDEHEGDNVVHVERQLGAQDGVGDGIVQVKSKAQLLNTTVRREAVR